MEPANWRVPTLADLPEIESVIRAWDSEYRSLDWSLFDEFRDHLRWDSGLPDVSRVVIEDGAIVASGWLQLASTSTLDLQKNYAFALPGTPHVEPLLRWLEEFRWAPGNRRIDRILEPHAGLPPEHRALYIAPSYEEFYSYVEMHRHLSTPLPDLHATDVRVVPWTPELHGALLPLYNDLFRGDDPLDEEQWGRTEMPGEDFDAIFSHVAYRGGRVVGFALSFFEKRRGEWVDPVIAGFGNTRQVVIGDADCGVEAALIDACAHSFRNAGIEQMCVQADDEDEVGIYESLGFAARREFVTWGREAPLGGAFA